MLVAGILICFIFPFRVKLFIFGFVLPHNQCFLFLMFVYLFGYLAVYSYAVYLCANKHATCVLGTVFT